MILGIVVNGQRNCVGIYKNEEFQYEKCWKVVKKKRKDILVEIDKLLKRHSILPRIRRINKVKLSDLKAIAVYQGPGSFTSLRVGISIANTLGWSLDIPVIGIKGNKYNQQLKAFSIIKKAKKIINNKKSARFNKPVQPYYQYSLK